MSTAVPDYDALVTAFRSRIDELQITTSLVDDLTGLPTGYTGKLLGPSRVKQLGMQSALLIAEALGLRMAIEPDMAAAARMAGRWEKREEIRRRVGVIRRKLSPEMKRAIMQEMGRIGGANQKRFRLSKQERSAIAKANVQKRQWRPLKRSPNSEWWSKPLGA
jgi:hypothetical protein